jgi:3-deoxy-D-manno-octulosonic-acid transferase
MGRPWQARLYTALYAPAAPAIAALLASRADSRARWRDYLGWNRFEGEEPAQGGLWFHAVSAGEVLSVAGLAEGLRRRVPGPGGGTVLTTTISDALTVASRRAAAAYPSRTFLPLDLPGCMGRLLDRLQPRLLVLSETDLWPNLLLELARRRIPVYLVNGRISPKAGRGYRLARGLMGPALAALRLGFLQSEEDRARLIEAGADGARLFVRPNTKYERPGGAPAAETASSRWLRATGRRVVLAASTHDPEEALLLDALRGLPDVLLVLAPRNPERAAAVRELAGPGTVLWSARTGERPPAGCGRIVVDTMGELDELYPAADAVVVGGSFGHRGGHNFLEPAWHGKAIVCGPDMANFRADVAAFVRGEALRQVASGGELETGLLTLLERREEAAAMGARARGLVEAASGISDGLAQELAADLETFERERARPRVLFCVSSGGLGGGERHALVLMKALRQTGAVAPTLACPGGGWLERSAREAGLPTESARFRGAWDVHTLFKLVRLLREGGFERVHTHLNVASLLGCAAARCAGVPSVATAHGLTSTLYYRRADRLLAVSEAVWRWFAGRSPGLAGRMTVAYTGLPALEPAEPRRLEEFRHWLGLEPAEPVFVCVGKLHWNKNQRLLVEAARLLPQDKPWRVLLVGAGPEEQTLRELAAASNGRVLMTGELDDPALVLGASSLLVVPSLREAFGLAALEAQQAGVPVVAAAVGGLPELVTDGRTGRLFPSGDASRLAGILAEYLEAPASFARMAAAARMSAARFDVPSMVADVLKAYRFHDQA